MIDGKRLVIKVGLSKGMGVFLLPIILGDDINLWYS